MRLQLAALVALTLVAGTASAAPLDVFTGRPYAAGVVQGGIFGADGADYYGEARPGGFVAARRPKPAVQAAPHRVARSTETGMAPVVARPYRP